MLLPDVMNGVNMTDSKMVSVPPADRPGPVKPVEPSKGNKPGRKLAAMEPEKCRDMPQSADRIEKSI